MRALVTGAGGFLGSHVVWYLLKHTDWLIEAVDSFLPPGGHWRLPDDNPRVNKNVADLTRTGSLLWSHLLNVQPNVVFNCASDSHVDASILGPERVWENNTKLALNLLQECRRYESLKAFFQVSTDEVYGPCPVGQAHFREWDAIIPSNPYSASKAAQEALAIAYWRTYSIPVIIVNCMNIIGERQDGEKFLPMILRKALAGESVPVHHVPGMVGSRFYLHASDVVDAMMAIFKKGPPGMYPDVDRPDRWHIPGVQEVENIDMVHAVLKAAGLTAKIEHVGKGRLGHDWRYALDGRKLLSFWQHKLTFQQAVTQTVEWYKANPSALEATRSNN